MEKLKAMFAANQAEFTAYVESNFSTSLQTEWETEDPKGHFSDDDDTKAVLAGIESGNEWAWCSVSVSVTIGEMTATDYLGACSYASAADFKAGGYYADMLLSCLTELHDGAKSILDKLA